VFVVSLRIPSALKVKLAVGPEMENVKGGGVPVFEKINSSMVKIGGPVRVIESNVAVSSNVPVSPIPGTATGVQLVEVFKSAVVPTQV